MTTTATSSIANDTTIAGQSISRAQMETLIAQSMKPLVFEECDFEGVDLSRLNM